MGIITEWEPARKLGKPTFKKNLKVQPGMMAAIYLILKHPDIWIETPSEFFRIAVRREVRAGKVGLYKNIKSPTKEKCTFPVSIKGWETHFPKDAKIIKAIVWARIKEESRYVGIECLKNK